MSTGNQLRRFLLSVCSIVATLGMLSTAFGQSVQLTAEQQRMLNQLPPAQRQQAMSALQQMQNQNAAPQQPLSSLYEAESDASQDTVSQGQVDSRPDPVAFPGSTLVIRMSIADGASADETRILADDPALQALEGSRAYQLDDNGRLELPGVLIVPLSGLSAGEIETRLGAEPLLRPYSLDVSILEPARTGASALEPFGYDVFGVASSGFDPVTTGPVPPDYVLGPGDSVRVQLFGNVNSIYEYEVTRDGVLNLPDLGPVTVAGLRFSEFRADLDRRVEEMLIGTQVSATMGRLRTIRIFVLGDANRPGSYVVSSLATMSSALYRAGGISEIGSLRDVQLKRAGDIVSRLDLYDLLLNGDTSGDQRLQPGDVVFVPPVGAQVSVDGAVKRPAIYETRGNTSVADVLRLAGGLAADAYPGGVRVERIESSAGRVVLSVDAGENGARGTRTRGGDQVFVPQVLEEYSDTVELVGHVQRPGPYQWRAGMRLTDVIQSMVALRPGADPGYLLLRREDRATRAVSIASVDLEKALADPGSADNIALMPADRIHVFSLEFGRQRTIRPLLEDLERQSRFGRPNPVVGVTGSVRAPGSYPLEPGMRVSDLIRAGGALTEAAYATKAELVRYNVVNDEYRSTEVVDVNLAAVLRGDASSDLPLREHDSLRISTLPEWNSQRTVSLLGEVTFPGEYRIRPGETMGDLLQRAGGLTDEAFPEGAVFLRESLRDQEQQQIDLLARRLEADLTSLSLQNADTTGAETLSTGRQLLSQLRGTEAIGRLVIDLDAIVANTAETPLELEDGDRLLVPKQPQSVTVIGETQQNTSHLFSAGLSRDDYIQQSGGLTRRADRKLIYVVRASGAVDAGSRSKWFGRNRSGRAGMRPGDTIVVPMDTERVRPLTLWTNVTQILYQAAIALAAIETFSN